MSVVVPPRSAGDRCPGALRVHQAADGGLVRVRLPGGQLDPARLRVLADVAADLGDGTLELTSRANLQIRGIPDDDAAVRLADRLAGAGLLPTPTHERVRNIVASPLSGRDDAGHLDVRGLVRDLDEAIRAEPTLAELSGRFLFALDDGRGDVTGLGADLGWRAGPGALLVAGRDTGLRVPAAATIATLVAAARAFLRLRLDAPEPAAVWRVADLPDGSGRLTRVLLDSGSLPGPTAGADPDDDTLGADRTSGAGRRRVPEITDDPAPRLGVARTPYGRLCVVAGARLGRLRADQARLLARVAAEVEGGAIVVTPWRSVVLDAAPPPAVDPLARLAAAGLIIDPASPWAGVSACTGRPGCARSLADVRADAAETIAGDTGPSTSDVTRLRLHWAGCDRRCGLPAGPVAVAVATGGGYRVAGPDGEPVPGPLPERVDRARRWR